MMVSQTAVISMVSSTASSFIILFINFPFERELRLRAGWFASLTRYAPSVRDIFAPQMRYCIAVRNSDMFACGERGGKYANINPRDLAHAVRSRAEGTYRAAGISHANKGERISQIQKGFILLSVAPCNRNRYYQKARPPLGDEAVLRGAAAGEATTAYGAYYIVGRAPRARAVSLMRCLPLLQPQSPFLQVHGELLRSQGTRKRIYRCRA